MIAYVYRVNFLIQLTFNPLFKFIKRGMFIYQKYLSLQRNYRVKSCGNYTESFL